MLGLLGSRVPESLKLFLLALAIVDDIGAVIVIAAFYSDGIDVPMVLLATAAVAGVVVARVLGIRWTVLYFALGAAGWLALHESGIHATLFGVSMGLLAPTTPHLKRDEVDVVRLADVSTRRGGA